MLALKEKVTHYSRFLLLIWAVVGARVHQAHADAEPRVLLLEAPEQPSGLLTALQIQLVGLAVAEPVPQPRAASAPEQIQAASALARDQGALAAVWVDPPLARASGAVMLYVVGEREGRALVEVVRVPGDRGPELERTLALKVREVIAELQRSAAAAPAAAQLLTPEPSPEPEVETSESSWHPLLALGARLGSQPGLGLARWGVAAGAGPAFTTRELRISGMLGGDWFPPREVKSAGGDRVRYWELGATLLAHAQLRLPAVWLGASLGPRLVWLQSEGFTVFNANGSGSSVIWGVAFGIDAEWPITSYLGLGADLQIEGLSVREHLRVNDVELVDVGRFRARLGLSIVLHPGS